MILQYLDFIVFRLGDKVGLVENDDVSEFNLIHKQVNDVALVLCCCFRINVAHFTAMVVKMNLQQIDMNDKDLESYPR